MLTPKACTGQSAIWSGQCLVTEPGAPVEDAMPDSSTGDESGVAWDGEVFSYGAQRSAKLGGQVAGGGGVVQIPQDAGAAGTKEPVDRLLLVYWRLVGDSGINDGVVVGWPFGEPGPELRVTGTDWRQVPVADAPVGEAVPA